MADYNSIFKLGLILAMLVIIFSVITYIFPNYEIDTKEETNNNLLNHTPFPTFVAISGPTPIAIPKPTFTPKPTEIPSVAMVHTPATFTISGYVKAPDNKRLSNNSIELSGNGVAINIYTDSNGNYIFNRLHNGNYTIRIETQKWKIQLNGTDIIKNLTIINTFNKKKK